MCRKFILVLLAADLGVATAQPQDTSPNTQSIRGNSKSFALYAARPRYPYEARAKSMQGTGVVLMRVDSRTGYVTSAQMLKSTGHKLLDDAALEAFRQWRFKPGTVSVVRSPITFTMRGLRF
jgi:TonB family protein